MWVLSMWEPTDDDVNQFGQYGANYVALCNELWAQLEQKSAEERVGSLVQFNDFLKTRVIVQKVRHALVCDDGFSDCGPSQ